MKRLLIAVIAMAAIGAGLLFGLPTQAESLQPHLLQSPGFWTGVGTYALFVGMTARTVVQSISGATLDISAGIPATYDQAGYEASAMVYTPIGEVENYGNHGVTAAITNFTPVDTAVVTKVKGSKDYGTMSLTVGSIPSDAGQAILDAAAESNNHYSAKLTYPDGEVHYLDVLVSKKEYQDGTVNNISMIAVDLALCRKPVVVAAV
jgi:hypothetical protein